MSMAFDDVCEALELDDNERARKTVAVRIIELARRGERSPTKLRDRVLAEANGLENTPLRPCRAFRRRYAGRRTRAIKNRLANGDPSRERDGTIAVQRR
jgi:hypothetical protein